MCFSVVLTVVDASHFELAETGKLDFVFRKELRTSVAIFSNWWSINDPFYVAISLILIFSGIKHVEIGTAGVRSWFLQMLVG